MTKRLCLQGQSACHLHLTPEGSQQSGNVCRKLKHRFATAAKLSCSHPLKSREACEQCLLTVVRGSVQKYREFQEGVSGRGADDGGCDYQA